MCSLAQYIWYLIGMTPTCRTTVQGADCTHYGCCADCPIKFTLQGESHAVPTKNHDAKTMPSKFKLQLQKFSSISIVEFFKFLFPGDFKYMLQSNTLQVFEKKDRGMLLSSLREIITDVCQVQCTRLFKERKWTPLVITRINQHKTLICNK